MDKFEGSKYYIQVPRRILDDERIKSDKTKLLYGEIYTMLNITGSFYMSNNSLKRRLHTSLATIHRSLRELETFGYIKSEIIVDENTKQTVGRVIHDTGVMSSTTRGGCHSCKKGSVTHDTQIDNNNISIKKNIYSATELHDASLLKEFNTLWNKFPNKKGKQIAFNHYKSWRKKSKDHVHEYLNHKLDDYIKYCEINKSWYHAMNGSTWFNGRFEDELDLTPPKPKRYVQSRYVEQATDWDAKAKEATQSKPKLSQEEIMKAFKEFGNENN